MSGKKPVGRGIGRPFEKGKSGNPKGRTKTRLEFQEMFQLDEDKFYLRLKVLALTGPPAAAIRAIELGFAYARGKPKEQVELSGPDGTPLAGPQVILYLPDNGTGVGDWKPEDDDETDPLGPKVKSEPDSEAEEEPDPDPESE